MKKTNCILMFALFVFVQACSKPAPDGQNTSQVTNSVLCETDIPGLKIINTSPRGWWYKENIYARCALPLEMLGVDQESMLDDVRVDIRYAEFPTVEYAEHALILHKNNVAACFENSWLWNKRIGNKNGHTFHVDYRGPTALLFRSETTCVLISCAHENAKKRRAACKFLAKKIIEKIKQGCHVIVSEENPPPATAPSP